MNLLQTFPTRGQVSSVTIVQRYSLALHRCRCANHLRILTHTAADERMLGRKVIQLSDVLSIIPSLLLISDAPLIEASILFPPTRGMILICRIYGNIKEGTTIAVDRIVLASVNRFSRR